MPYPLIGAAVAALCLSGCTPAPSQGDNADANSANGVPVAADCGKDAVTTQVDFAVREPAVLHSKPDDKSRPNTIPVPYEPGQKDALIDSSIPVREICRAGKWSQVRILLPEDMRSGIGWVHSAVLRPIKTDDKGRRIYKAADFEWPEGTARYKGQVVAVANKIMREDQRCEAINDRSLTLTRGNGAEFLLACVGPSGTLSISFSAADAGNGRSFTQAAGDEGRSPNSTLASATAYLDCRPTIESRLSRPETADFNASDTTFHEDGNNARFTITGTAENAFGASVQFTAMCHFRNGSLTSVDVSQG